MLEQIRIDDPQQLSVMTGRPPLPGQLKIAGYANLVVGPLLAIVNLILVGRSISELERINAPDGLSVFFEVNIGMFCVLGVFLVIGGIGLLCNQRWGRILSLITGVLCVLSAMIAAVMNKVMENLLTSGAIPLRPGQQSFYFKGISGVPGAVLLYGILLIVLLMLPAAREWARRGRASARTTTDGAGDVSPMPTAVRPTNGLAIASLVCSMIPFVLLTQIAGLTLGIVALVKIRKSNGAIGGKGFAIAGIIISSLILLFIGGILLLVLLNGGFK